MKSPLTCASIRCNFACAISVTNKRGADALTAVAKQAKWQERPSPLAPSSGAKASGARRGDIQSCRDHLRRRG